MLLNKTELADMFGVSTKTIDKRVADGMPVRERPDNPRQGYRFDSAECINWLLEQGKSDTMASKLEEAEYRERAAKASLAELDLATKRKVAISVDDARRVVQAVLGVAKGGLTALPGRIAQIGANKSAEELLRLAREEVNSTLADMAATNPFKVEPVPDE